jgi:hypothetical protein
VRLDQTGKADQAQGKDTLEKANAATFVAGEIDQKSRVKSRNHAGDFYSLP